MTGVGSAFSEIGCLMLLAQTTMASSAALIGASVAWRFLAAAALLVLTLLLTMPNGRQPSSWRRVCGAISGIAGLVLLWWAVPQLDSVSQQGSFRGFALLTLVSAVATVSSRNPVYCAIWFAISLLGVSALYLLQGAQFLGIATIAVYAGAIVVTFLFVLMLAQPEGHAFYDRISWGLTPRIVATITAVFFAVLVAMAVTLVDENALARQTQLKATLSEVVRQRLPGASVTSLRMLQRGDDLVARVTVSLEKADQRKEIRDTPAELQLKIAETFRDVLPGTEVDEVQLAVDDVLAVEHTAHLGGQLFGRHLVSVQAVAALMMAALVGAVAIATRSGELDSAERGEA